jgi:hypothetical protein
MAHLTPAERDKKGLEAYRMSVRGFHAPEIAQALRVNEKTVDRLLKRERAKAAAAHAAERDYLLHTFVGEQDAVQTDAWRRLSAVKDNGMNVPGLQSNILTASKNKATAYGLLKERIEHGGEITIKRYVGIVVHGTGNGWLCVAQGHRRQGRQGSADRRGQSRV